MKKGTKQLLTFVGLGVIGFWFLRKQEEKKVVENATKTAMEEAAKNGAEPSGSYYTF